MNTATAKTISVIIPAFNAGKYIEETIDSVLSQTYKAYEIIVVDDGSTDNTYEAASSFGDKIKLYRRENSGISITRNFGASKATGNWLAFLDADDIWEVNKLEDQVNSLGGKRWSHTNSLYVGENQDGKTSRSDLTPQYGGDIFPNLIKNNFITTSTVIIEKDFYLQAGGFDESMPILEDWQLWLDMSLLEPIAYSPELLAKYRVYSGSSSRRARYMLPQHIQFINKIFSSPSMDRKYYSLKDDALAQSYSIISYIAEDAKDYSFSFICAVKSFRYDRSKLNSFKRIMRTLINMVFRK